jgi:hypothetical protein
MTYIDAVKRNKLVKKASRADIEQTAKLWLRYACDRSGGRLHRPSKQSKKDTDVESD